MNYTFINARKKELGINNAQLAAQAGVTQSTMDKITSGANQNPTLDTMQAIARVLGCTLSDFDDNPNNQSSSLNDRELQLLNHFRLSSIAGQELILKLVRAVSETLPNPDTSEVEVVRDYFEQQAAIETAAHEGAANNAG